MIFHEIDLPEDFPPYTEADLERDLFGAITVNQNPGPQPTLADLLDDGRRFHDGSDWDERSGYENQDDVVGVGEEKLYSQ
jgi:hypothetical protein